MGRGLCVKGGPAGGAGALLCVGTATRVILLLSLCRLSSLETLFMSPTTRIIHRTRDSDVVQAMADSVQLPFFCFTTLCYLRHRTLYMTYRLG